MFGIAVAARKSMASDLLLRAAQRGNIEEAALLLVTWLRLGVRGLGFIGQTESSRKHALLYHNYSAPGCGETLGIAALFGVMCHPWGPNDGPRALIL